MDPVITTRDAFRVIGYAERINPREADYDRLWGQGFMPHHDAVQAVSCAPDYYGLYYCTDQPPIDDFVAGMAVAPGAEPPAGLVARDVAAGLEAVFACNLATIGQTWQQVHGEWLPASEYEYDPARPCYEEFPPTEPGPAMALTIHVPLRRRSA